MKKLLVAALLASAIAVPASAAELVVNGGFEDPVDGFAGWSTVIDSMWVMNNSSAAHSGDMSVLIGASSKQHPDELYQTLNTVVGQTYTWSYWIAAAGNQQFPSSFVATIGALKIGDATNSGTVPYINLSGTYVATSASTEIHFTAFNSAGVYQLDDISVTGPLAVSCENRVCGGDGGAGGVPEPESWALMVLGFGGLGAALRRRPRLQTA